ncbi:MAG: class I SAM-dependent methyltransferase [Ignavibacteriae bacterium]|nr:class I SAM-dependent methyltransferase [Ignavibacteriota bacterium]MCB9215016.1 class I SAM-dependent methyltransferase [Ignavibacteria bacterium]
MSTTQFERKDSTTRFSDRVEAYIKYRPGYPDGLIASLHDLIGLNEESVIADIGSGTGISSELFLRNGMAVYGVEPNDGMREAAERLLNQFDQFRSVNGTAEATTLQDNSVDLIVAAQAFHWFDREAVKEEWQRILKPGGSVLLFWNSRRTDSSPFLQAYEEMLLTFGTDYQQINHQNISDEDILQFFYPMLVQKLRLYNEQQVDFDGLRGRLESSSYAPSADHPDYKPMIDRLSEIFAEYRQDGFVCIEYDLEVFISSLEKG